MSKEINTESGYGKRYAIRRSLDNGNENPKPRPLLDNYFPPRRNASRYNKIEHVLLPIEDSKLIVKFCGEYINKPKKVRYIPTVKYDHFKMNYYQFA